MATHKLHLETNTFYFITFTCHKWLPLIDQTDLYDYFPFWVSKLNEKGVMLSGYVIMPNHIHMLVYVKGDNVNLNQILAEGKRFMAYEIVKRLKSLKETSILTVLKKAVAENERKKGKKHQVFKSSFDAKICEGDKQINAVLDYMHANPVSGKWNLVDDYVDFPWSSARFCEENKPADIPILDYREI